MADDYISREAAIKVIQDIINHYHECYVSNARAETAEWCLEKLKGLLAADVQPVRHGRWIEQSPDFDLCGVAYYKCSECGKEQQLNSHYCQFCGAKMDGDGE